MRQNSSRDLSYSEITRVCSFDFVRSKDVVSYSSIAEKHVRPINFKMTVISDDDWSRWNDVVSRYSNLYYGSSVDAIFTLASPSVDNDKYAVFYRKAYRAYQEYKEDLDGSDEENKVSSRSLFELMRYFPALERRGAEIFVDSDSGLFGSAIHTKRSGTLNILLEDNGRIAYAFTKKDDGDLIQISGRASFKRKLTLSKNINKLMRLLDD